MILKCSRATLGIVMLAVKYSVNRSLGKWCSAMRCTYNQIQHGQTQKRNLTQDQIERLEEIGFKWKLE